MPACSCCEGGTTVLMSAREAADVLGKLRDFSVGYVRWTPNVRQRGRVGSLWVEQEK